MRLLHAHHALPLGRRRCANLAALWSSADDVFVDISSSLPFVDRYTSHVIFLMRFYTQSDVHTTLHGSRRATQCVCVASWHPRCVLGRLLSISSCLSFSCFSVLFTAFLPYPTCTLTSTSSLMSTASRELTTALSQNEKYCSMAIYHPPTGYEPKRP